jgi:hypothetical protein
MSKLKKLSPRAEGGKHSKTGLVQAFENIPQMATHLGGDRTLLILIAAIGVGGLVCRVAPADLAITEALILAAWMIGKGFKWF